MVAATFAFFGNDRAASLGTALEDHAGRAELGQHADAVGRRALPAARRLAADVAHPVEAANACRVERIDGADGAGDEPHARPAVARRCLEPGEGVGLVQCPDRSDDAGDAGAQRGDDMGRERRVAGALDKQIGPRRRAQVDLAQHAARRRELRGDGLDPVARVRPGDDLRQLQSSVGLQHPGQFLPHGAEADHRELDHRLVVAAGAACSPGAAEPRRRQPPDADSETSAASLTRKPRASVLTPGL
jgi:hypothetical protein